MHSGFGFQPAIGVFTLDPHGHRFDASLLARALLYHLQLETARLAPARIHPGQHLRPILRLGSTGTSVNLEKTVIAVSFARQQTFELPLVGDDCQLGQRLLGLGDDILFTLDLAQLNQANGILHLTLQRGDHGELPLQPVLLAHGLLRNGLIIPEIRLCALHL